MQWLKNKFKRFSRLQDKETEIQERRMKMVIIAGLGNPTKEYENTRHNIGFMAIDALADKYNIHVMDFKQKALI